MHKLNLKLSIAAVVATATFYGNAHAVEQAPKVSAGTGALHAVAELTSPNGLSNLSARTPATTATDKTSTSRSSSSSANETNTVGMLLAGLAIMGLVVRRRLDQ